MIAALRLKNVLEMVRDALERDEGAVEAYLFGSYARGDFSEESDVDVLVVSERPRGTREKLLELSWRVLLELEVPVSFVVVPRSRWEVGATPLRAAVMTEGRLIWRRGGR